MDFRLRLQQRDLQPGVVFGERPRERTNGLPVRPQDAILDLVKVERQSSNDVTHCVEKLEKGRENTSHPVSRTTSHNGLE